MSIEDIKKKYELEWMKLDRVEGVGITDEDGKKVIVIYLSKKTSDNQKIPDQIEGYPVIKKLSGEFKAF